MIRSRTPKPVSPLKRALLAATTALVILPIGLRAFADDADDYAETPEAVESAQATPAAPADAAEGASTQVAEAPTYATQEGMLMVSPAAQAVLGHAAAARRAMFGDDLEEAATQVGQAIEALGADEAASAGITLADEGADGAVYLPVKVGMRLSERFSATRENLGALQEAYGLQRTAQPDEALEVLRLASIDGGVSALLMPSDESMTHLVEARQALADEDVGAANRALIAIGSEVVAKTFPFHAIPQQGPADAS